MPEADEPMSSEELLRRSKESIAAPPLTPHPSSERPPLPADELEDLSVPVEPAERLSQLEFVVSAPPAERRGSKPARVTGVVLLTIVGLFWLMLVIGIAVDPTDVGYAILGGIILSGLPFAIGVYLVRRGIRR